MGKTVKEFWQEQLFHSFLQRLVQTNGEACCYDRYCRDDEWTYCIFCEEGDFDPYAPRGWKHAPDCLMREARALLDRWEEEMMQESAT